MNMAMPVRPRAPRLKVLGVVGAEAGGRGCREGRGVVRLGRVSWIKMIDRVMRSRT